eukprot:scaffold7028_cov243-Pinguiococcus_pyrenoidosus.AAC.13
MTDAQNTFSESNLGPSILTAAFRRFQFRPPTKNRKPEVLGLVASAARERRREAASDRDLRMQSLYTDPRSSSPPSRCTRTTPPSRGRTP